MRIKYNVDANGYNHGKALTYSEDGSLKFKSEYNGGFIVSKEKYNSAQKLENSSTYVTEGPFRGKLINKKFFQEDGKSLSSESFYKNGFEQKKVKYVKNGKYYINFYNDGKLYLTKFFDSQHNFYDSCIYSDGKKSKYKQEADLNKALEKLNLPTDD